MARRKKKNPECRGILRWGISGILFFFTTGSEFKLLKNDLGAENAAKIGGAFLRRYRLWGFLRRAMYKYNFRRRAREFIPVSDEMGDHFNEEMERRRNV